MARLRSIETARTDLPAIRHFVTLEVDENEVDSLKLGEQYELLREDTFAQRERLIGGVRHKLAWIAVHD
jgi:hypothetical protein